MPVRPRLLAVTLAACLTACAQPGEGADPATDGGDGSAAATPGDAAAHAGGPLGADADADAPDGWVALFDGRTLAGWRGYRRDDVPDGWVVDDGCIHRAGPGGDIISVGQYEDFELALQWKVAPGANSGIFFHVTEAEDHGFQTGPEMQVLDNTRHPDGRSPLTSAGANYGLHAPARDVTRPVGEFNDVLLRVDGGHVEHWLNGVKLLEYDLGSPAWETLVAGTKFAAWPGYGRAGRGHIALQDHGDPVWYRHIRLREL